MERHDLPVETMWSDDGIVIRLPEAADELPLETLLIDPDEIDEIVVSALPQTVAVLRPLPRVRRRGRCCCPVAGPISARRCGSNASGPPTCSRSPSKYPTFPILLETSPRVPAGRVRRPGPARGARPSCARRQVRMVHVETAKRRRSHRACCSTGSPPTCTKATPRWPSAGPRRSLSTAICCASCSAPRSCASCSTQASLADLELELQCLTDGRRARTADELHDVLRRVGDLVADRARAALRGRAEPTGGSAAVGRRAAGDRARDRRRAADRRRRGRRARIATRWDARIPIGLPAAFTDPVPRPLEELDRPLRPHPRPVPAPTCRRGSVSPRSSGIAGARRARGRRSGRRGRVPARRASEREWCDVDVLRQLRRRSLAALRREIEPVEQAALARFLPAWHGIGGQRRGLDALVETIGVAAGRGDRRPRRSNATCSPPGSTATGSADLDELCTTGDVVWVGAGPIGSGDGRIRLCFRDQVALLAPGSERTGPARRRAARGDPHPARRAGGRRSGSSCGWPTRRLDRRRGARRPVGSGVGRRGHQRLARPAARRCSAASRRGRRAAAAPALADRAAPDSVGSAAIGPPAGCRAVVPGRATARPGPDPDRGRSRPGDAAARAPRRGDPRGSARRRRRRWVRRRLRRAQGARGARPGPSRVLRRRARRRPVRPSRRRRSSSLGARSCRSVRRDPAAGGALPPPTPPSPTAQRSPGRTRRGGRRAAQARSSPSPTASPRSGSTLAVTTSSRSPALPRTTVGRSPSPNSCAADGVGRWRSANSMAPRSNPARCATRCSAAVSPTATVGWCFATR